MFAGGSLRSSCRSLPLGAARLLIAKEEALNLAARCFWQRLDEVDLPREGVLAESRADEVDQLGPQRVVSDASGVQYDEGLDDLAPLIVGLADHGALSNSVVFEQAALDIERADPVAGRGDDIVTSTHEADGAVVILLDRVTGQVVVADPPFALCTELLPSKENSGESAT